jgi:peptide/nickel transport system permease protein
MRALRTVGVALLTLWGLVTLLFLIFNQLGDPAAVAESQRSDLRTREAIRADLGLDQPPLAQYLHWLNDLSPVGWLGARQLASGNYQYLPVYQAAGGAWVVKLPYLRRSFQTNRPVLGLYLERLPATALLACSSLLIAAVLGIGMGTLAARQPGGWLDGLLTGVAMLGLSMPSFVAALLAAWLLAYELHDWTGLYPTGYVWQEGLLDPAAGRLDLRYLILPALTLGLRPLSVVVQLTREQLIALRGAEFARTARAKGLGPWAVEWRHLLPNALNPVLTALSAWFGALLGGSFFVESIFDWPGVGKLAVDALMTNDYPVLMGCCLFTAVLFLLIQAGMEWLYRLLDPRIG